jgi:hypothetical protein
MKLMSQASREMMSADHAPIFVVGVPRSGTTLLAAMLAGHSELSCGPETRIFHFLRRAGLMWKENWEMEQAIDFLLSLQLAGHTVLSHYNLTEDQLRSYLRERPIGVPVLLSSLTEQFMQRESKRRWIEKSPEHLLYVEEIRNFFPTSPIIRIVRDPRDTALSLMKVPWGPPSFLEALFLWRRYDEKSSQFFQCGDNVHTVYYEPLLVSPAAELKKICEFLGEEYNVQMLETSRSAEKLITRTETHKHRVYEAIDQTRFEVWKRELSAEQNRLAEAVLGDRLSTYGYECIEHFDHVAAVYPSAELLLTRPRSIFEMVREGVAMWGDRRDPENQVLIYVGEPDRDRWLQNGRPERWWELLSLVIRVIARRLAGRDTWWVTNDDGLTHSGTSSTLIRFIFNVVGVKRIPSQVDSA